MNITNFSDAFGVLMINEGKFTLNPKDPGNWSTGRINEGILDGTMWGISCRVAHENGYKGSMKYLPRETAELIAKKHYWDPLHLDHLDSEVAFQVLDANYHGGSAAKWLQRACGVEEDGVIGSKTLASANACDKRFIMMRFNAYRIKYLVSCKIFPDFGKGWMNRIAANLLEGAD